MRYEINNKYVVRQNLKNEYILYDKSQLKTYTLSYKLFFILNLFSKYQISKDFLEGSFKNKGISLNDFNRFLNEPQFKDVLVPCTNQERKIENFCQKRKSLPNMTYNSPERVDFFITKHCNLACKHCFESSSPTFPISYFNKKDIDIALSKIDDANVRTLKITGGEPFSHPDIDVFLDKASECHFETIILTNALLLTPERIRKIKEGNMQLGISLDGVSSDTYDFIRGRGNFKKLLPILKLLKETGAIYCFTCTINKYNFFEIKSIINKSLNELGAQTLFINRLRPLGRTSKNTDIAISKDEIALLYKIFQDTSSMYGDRIQLSDDSKVMAMDTDACTTISCAAGNSIIALDNNFNVFPCIYGVGFNSYKMGNLLKESLEDIWMSEKWSKFRGDTTLQELEDCRDCKFSGKCSLKNCRLKPVFEGRKFTSSVSYCKHTA